MKKLAITILLLSLSFITFSQVKKPTIMVVPSDVWCLQNNYSMLYDDELMPDYNTAIKTDPNLLLAIGKINTMMAERGFPLKDLNSVLKSIKQQNIENKAIKSKKSGAQLAESPIDVLHRVAKSDIIMQITYTQNQMGPKYSITYNLQGIDAYTNKQIAGAQGTGKQTFSAEIPVLIEEAIVNNMDDFCQQLMNYFDDIQKNGREASIDINVFDNGNGINLESEYDGKELSEIIDDWMAFNTVNHMFNKTDGSENYTQYEQVRIPLYNENGNQIDTESFTRNLRTYLKKNYYIESKIMTRGLGRCILIIGEK